MGDSFGGLVMLHGSVICEDLSRRRVTYEKHSIDIVYIPILPSSIVKGVFRHRDLRTIKYGWLHASVLANLIVPCDDIPRSYRSRCRDWEPSPDDGQP